MLAGRTRKRGVSSSIGEKGHGTKITYNSNRVTVYTRTSDKECSLKADLNGPKRALNMALKNSGEPPEIIFDEISGNCEEMKGYCSGTCIRIEGYDNNNYNAFAHGPLMDYIQWYTVWGRIHTAWEQGLPKPSCKLFLKGVGVTDFEEIPYGHPFPKEDFDFQSLRKKDDRRPENYYVRRWLSGPIKVQGFPDNEIRIVFSVEGDSIKREYNQMLKRTGRPSASPFPWEDGRYNVADRYGIYVCKDFIPIERKNERFADRSEWTKWHAFINCQGFSLTANRASVENTPAQLLNAIYQTADKYIYEYVLNSDEYEEFAKRIALEAGRRKAEREKKDVARRLKEYTKKACYKISFDSKKMEFLEPRSEQGVLWLLAKLVQVFPEYFKDVNVIDLDAHFGYDLLVLKKHPITGADEPAFIELKFNLRDDRDFNHSFEYLHSLICWKTSLHDGEELCDLSGNKRVVKFTPKGFGSSYTKCFLIDPSGGKNIEVIALYKYLEEVLSMKQR